MWIELEWKLVFLDREKIFLYISFYKIHRFYSAFASILLPWQNKTVQGQWSNLFRLLKLTITFLWCFMSDEQEFCKITCCTHWKNPRLWDFGKYIANTTWRCSMKKFIARSWSNLVNEPEGWVHQVWPSWVQ